MIKRESLHKKLAIAAMAGMLMLLLAASCVAQTPLDMSEPENCTNCSANASSSPGLDDAVREMVLVNASVRQELETPILDLPSGIVKTGKLAYTWYAVGGCQYYCLEVRDGQDAIVIRHWYEALDITPVDGIISVTPLEILGPGTYTWSVLCRDCGSDDQLSDLMEFTVCTSSSFPGRATLVSPKDNIGGMSPTFVWLPVSGCTQYRLKVVEANYPNELVFDEDLNVEDVYSDTDKVCSFAFESIDLYLNPGSYRWWIKAVNCNGEGPWSYYKSFRYVDTPPGKSTPLSPRGLISTGTPTFTWTASPLATEYHLQVINYQNEEDIVVAEGDFRADEVTKGSKCSGSLGALLDDDPVYYWRVQANNDASPFDDLNPEAPSWSSWRYFETICAYKPGTDAKKARMG
jgi:hypothetical protein